MQIDLHIHSVFSDGKITITSDMTPIFRDYCLVSFTDHEHIFDPATISFNKKICFISGVEICCHHNANNIEILGYNFDVQNQRLIELVEKVKELRIHAIKTILQRNSYSTERLTNNPFRFNVPLPDEVNPGVFWTKNNLEYKSIYHSIPAHEVISAIINAKGIPVLAHPMESFAGKTEKEVEKIIMSLGLDIVELNTPKHNKNDYFIIDKIIERNGLFASIGSDSHGDILTKIPYHYCLNERKYGWISQIMNNYQLSKLC